jgi:hypothetical protein
MLFRELDGLVAASSLADNIEALLFEYFAQIETNDRLVLSDHDGSGQWVYSFIDSRLLLGSDCPSHYELGKQVVLGTLQLGDSGTGGVAGADHRPGVPLGILPVAVGQWCLGNERPNTRLIRGFEEDVELLFDDRQLLSGANQAGMNL